MKDLVCFLNHAREIWLFRTILKRMFICIIQVASFQITTFKLFFLLQMVVNLHNRALSLQFRSLIRFLDFLNPTSSIILEIYLLQPTWKIRYKCIYFGGSLYSSHIFITKDTSASFTSSCRLVTYTEFIPPRSNVVFTKGVLSSSNTKASTSIHSIHDGDFDVAFDVSMSSEEWKSNMQVPS